MGVGKQILVSDLLQGQQALSATEPSLQAHHRFLVLWAKVSKEWGMLDAGEIFLFKIPHPCLNLRSFRSNSGHGDDAELKEFR